MRMIFFRFFLSGKLFISPCIVKNNLDEYNSLGCKFLHLITLSILCQSLLACKISVEKSTDTLMGAPLQVTNCSLTTLKILSLSFTFDILIKCGPLWVHLLRSSLYFLNTYVYYFTRLGKVLVIISSKRFLILSSPPDIPMMYPGRNLWDNIKCYLKDPLHYLHIFLFLQL